jgi:fructose-1,6-bisphosphatase I
MESLMSTQTSEEAKTLDAFLSGTIGQQGQEGRDFVSLCQSIATAGKMISSKVNLAGLAGMLGETGETNVQGELVQMLDQYAHDAFLDALSHRGHTGIIVSEEAEEAIVVDSAEAPGRFLVAVDPLDGSSNIDCNVTIGTIFAVFKKRGARAAVSDLFHAGEEIYASGYVIYGSGTLIVLATDDGVNGFTLDPAVGEFFLSHPNMAMPVGKIYSCNDAYSKQWVPGYSRWIDDAKDAGWKARYVGSLVADVHRNLLKGGVYFYPASTVAPQGKLRLLYEGFPLAYMVEKAGGAATDGIERILDKVPTSLHERTPLVIGGHKSVAELTRRAQEDI